MSDIEIEIDGKKLQAKPNAMVIQVADEAGIYIPRFCYHKHLTVAANCRMCLVEVEKSPKTLPACATPVMPGMKVLTRSPKAIAAQKAVMEFLLINHPLDCPICDQGGECELQDISMGYGSAESFYNEGKRSFKDKDLGPLIASEMTRCIQCTRCVRFGEEVAGFRELGATNRGERMEIGTYVQHALQSEISGNIIDLCPVGALTSKPYRFTARPWELQQHPGVSPHDCLGSNLFVHTRRGQVMRVVPRENQDINQTWLSDRDRYSYDGLYHPDRLTKPLIKEGQQWREVDWETAITFAAEGLLNINDPNQIAALASPNSTLEEFYLLQKLVRSLGSSNIDYRLRQTDFSYPEKSPIPSLNMALADLNQCDVIILVGSNVQKEQPLASIRIRQASLAGTKVIAINMMDYAFHFKLSAKKIIAPQRFVHALKEILSNKDSDISKLIASGKKIAVLLGQSALNHPQATNIQALAHQLAKQNNGTFGFLSEGANAAGAWIAGAIPKGGLNAKTCWEQSLKGYLLLNVEPDLDCANPVSAIHALEQAEFVVSLSMFRNPIIEQCARVILPISPFTETSGTFVNAELKWQSFKRVAEAFGESKPAWKVLRVLANLMNLEGFEYVSSEEVRDEVSQEINHLRLPAFDHALSEKPINDAGLTRIGEIPLYSGDSLVRRAKVLQATQPIMEGNLFAARMNAETAQRLQLKEADNVRVKQQGTPIQMPVIIDSRVPSDAVFIPGGMQSGSALTELFGPIEVQK